MREERRRRGKRAKGWDVEGQKKSDVGGGGGGGLLGSGASRGEHTQQTSAG